MRLCRWLFIKFTVQMLTQIFQTKPLHLVPQQLCFNRVLCFKTMLSIIDSDWLLNEENIIFTITLQKHWNWRVGNRCVLFRVHQAISLQKFCQKLNWWLKKKNRGKQRLPPVDYNAQKQRNIIYEKINRTRQLTLAKFGTLLLNCPN